MLTEIALTPHTLFPCTIDAKGWQSQLRASTSAWFITDLSVP